MCYNVPITSGERGRMSDKKEYKAFVIMPFDDEFTAVYTDLLVSTLEEVGYTVSRADSFFDQENIMSTVIRCIAESDLIVAELTKTNPNVYYELGIAHALRKNVILITKYLNTLPFDLRSYRIIEYSTEFDKVDDFKSQLETIAIGAVKETIIFRNPVTDFLPKNVENEIVINPEAANEEIANHEYIQQGEDNRGFYDYLNDTVEAMEDITKITGNYTFGMLYMTNVMNSSTSDIKGIDLKKRGNLKRVYEIADNVAEEMNNTAEYYEDLLEPYEDAWKKLQTSQDNLFTGLPIISDEDRMGAGDYLAKVFQLRDSIVAGVESTKDFRNTINSLNINVKLNLARKRKVKALDNFLQILEKGVSICENTAALLEKMIADYKE
jgi:hypothetical protein